MRPLSIGRPYGWPGVLAVVSAFGFALLNVVTPVVIQRMIDLSLPQGDVDALLTNALLLVLLFVVQSLFLLVRIVTIARIAATTALKLRTRMLEHCQRSLGHDRFHASVPEVQEVFSKHLQVLEHFFLWTAPRVVYSAVMGAPSVVMLFVIDWRLALLTLFCGLPMVLGPMAASARYRRLARLQLDDQRRLVDTLHDILSHLTIVRVFGLEAHWQERFGRLARHAEGHDRAAGFWNGLAPGLAMGGSLLARLLVVIAGAYLVLSGQSTVGALVAFLNVLVNIVISVSILAESVPLVLQADESAARVEALLPGQESSGAARGGERPAPPLRETLRLEAVSFGYGEGRLALEEVSLEIEAGQRVALVGPSGSGKSTMLALLLGLGQPQSGAVTWDGIDTRTLERGSLLAQIGAVLQNTTLFDLSIYENILMGRLEASREEVIAAARAAELHDAVVTMPQGYDTVVGPGGSNLSGGQRQRVVLARALLRSPSLLVLDEATSALDPKSEAAITGTLQRLGRNRTVVAVTHRLETVRDYDVIFVMCDGRVVEHGTHAALLAQQRLYADMFHRRSDATSAHAEGHEPGPSPAPSAPEIALEAG